MLFNQLLRSISRATGRQVANIFGGWATEAASSELAVSLTYGVAVAVDASRGNVQSLAVTDGVAYAINSPTNPPATGYGQLLALIIVNAGVVASGLGTFGAGYTDTGDVPVLQPGERVVVTFRWNGTTWLELSRSSSAAADALQVRRQVTQLTNAQILAIPTVINTLSPVPAAGKMFRPIYCCVVVDRTAGAYGNVGTDGSIFLGDSDGNGKSSGLIGNDSAASLTQLTDLLTTGPDGIYFAEIPCQFFVVDPGPLVTGITEPATLVSARALSLIGDNPADFTGGNAANSMTITLLYIELEAS